MMTLEEAKSSIKYYKISHPNEYKEIGGDKITDIKIEEALDVVTAISGALDISEDELLKRELSRLCNDN